MGAVAAPVLRMRPPRFFITALGALLTVLVLFGGGAWFGASNPGSLPGFMGGPGASEDRAVRAELIELIDENY